MVEGLDPFTTDKRVTNVCSYCQGAMVYSNDDNPTERYTDGDYDVGFGVYDEAIKVAQNEKGDYYLMYSDGADEDGVQNFFAIGVPINYCPNCGRKL